MESNQNFILIAICWVSSIVFNGNLKICSTKQWTKAKMNNFKEIDNSNEIKTKAIGDWSELQIVHVHWTPTKNKEWPRQLSMNEYLII